MKTLLVPFDFSHEAQKALDYALDLSTSKGASLVVYYAFSKEEKASAIKNIDQLKAYLNELDRNDVLLVNKVVGDKSVFYQSLWNVAHNCSADLIISGTKGIDSYFSVKEETNSSQMITQAPCPVLILKDKGKTDFKSILITSEFINTDNDKEFQVVKELIQLYQPRVTFLYVDQDDKHTISLQDIEAFADKWKITDYTSEIVSDTTAVNAIYEVSKEVKADLVVLGYHKSREKEHAVYGSLAADFINHSKFQVVTIHL